MLYILTISYIGKFLLKLSMKLTKFAVIGKKIIKFPKNVCQHEFYSHTEFQIFLESCRRMPEPNILTTIATQNSGLVTLYS